MCFLNFPTKLPNVLCVLRPSRPHPSIALALPPPSPSERHLSAMSGHRYSFRWLLTVVAAVAVVDHNELENYAWYFRALSKRKLCNQFVQLGCLEYVTKLPQSRRHHATWLRAHFGGIDGGRVRVRGVKCIIIVFQLTNRLTLQP